MLVRLGGWAGTRRTGPAPLLQRTSLRWSPTPPEGLPIALRLITLRNETVELFRPSRAPVAFRTRLSYGIVSGITVVICCLIFGPVEGAFALFGSFAAQWINGRPFALRLRTMLVVTGATVASTSIGVLSAHLGLFVTPVIVGVVIVVALLYYTFVQLQGPGPLNLFYGVALGSYIGLDPTIGWHFVGITALAGVIATTLSCLLLVPDPRRPEKKAIRVASDAVADYESVASLGGVVQGDIVRQARSEAYDAVNRGWIVVHAARLHRRHRIMDSAMTSVNRRLAAAVATSLTWPGPDRVVVNPSVQNVLSLRFRAAHGLRPSSVAWFTAWRIGLAGAAAGLVTQLVTVGHPYWAILTTTIIVHAWTSRISMTRRAVARALGTVVGVLVFAGITLLEAPAWVDVAIMIACMIALNLVVMSNYTIGVMFITPMALLSADLGNSAPPLQLASDRVIETLIGAVLAVLVIWLTGLGFPKRVAVAQFRRTALATEAVLSSLALHGRSNETMGHRNELQYELITNGAAATKAAADDPALAAWMPAERVVTDLGYAALAACWLPSPVHDAPIVETVRVLRDGLAHPGVLNAPESAVDLLTRARAAMNVGLESSG